MPTVSFVLGYIVLWPSVLTFFVSTAKINPSRPPWIVAVSVEFGREMTARPVVNTTHLVNWEIRNQLQSTLERDESRNVRRRKRTRLAHGGQMIGKEDVLHGRSIVKSAIELGG